jgi:Secretion system C-terminal sorting domain
MKLLKISIIILFVSSAWCSAQTTVYYKYDDAGNRIERNIVPLQSARPDSSDQNEKKVFEDDLGNKKVLIYPNPTRGQLQIELIGYDKETKTNLFLYNLSGALLMSKSITNSSEIIDLSTYPVGMYILKIVWGDKTSEWKIIKE